MAPSWITISNTLPGGPWKLSTSSARMMWPVEDTGKNSVRPSTTPISTVFQISVRSIGSILETLGARPSFFGHAATLHHLEIDDVLLVAELDHQADRLAMAARTRQLVTAQRVEAAVGAEHQELVDRLGMHGKARPVAFLVLELARGLVVEMALRG